MIRIIGVQERMKQGQTEPVLCLAEDGLYYVVKCARAGRRSLISEWIAGNIAKALRLPVPEFAILEYDREAAQYSANPDAASIAEYPVFGSRFVKLAGEISQENIAEILEQTRARVLLFDWWVQNGDRTMIDGGGNPNLLWIAHKKELVLIDQNLAFVPATAAGFWTEHIFRADRRLWTPEFKAGIIQEMRAVLRSLEEHWKAMPEEWVEFDCGLTFDSVHDLLWRFDREPEAFWTQE